jgi:anaerobic magnesium-protoporphyrin IX monomethyl ester cyclase
MADILLAHCNHLFFDRKQVRKMQPYPPLQTLMAAACLREAGHDVALYDSTFETPPEEGFRRALAEHQPQLVAICEDNFNFLTKMCLTQNRELAFAMMADAGAAGVPVVVNGSDATDQADAYLDAGAQFVMVGEVERTLVELAARLLNRGSVDADDIAGLAFRDPASGALKRTRPRELLTDLDSFPLPAWDLVPVEVYRQRWMEAHGYFSVNMISSRGCPYRCNWCAKPIYGDTYHNRGPRLVAEQVLALKNTIAPDHLWFADDIFALSGEWTREFAQAVEDLGTRIPFKMQSRCDLMTRDTVEALRQAGCEEVWMGAESGSQNVLDDMDKDVLVDQIYEARENLRRHGIRACYFLQFGYPGETWEDIQRTIRMVRDTQPDDIGISVSYPLPGTRFYERVSEQLGKKRNWSDSDDLAMMFQGTYRSEFYKALRDALHFEVENRNGASGTSLSANGVSGNETGGRLEELWRKVEEMETTHANADPTPTWTSS